MTKEKVTAWLSADGKRWLKAHAREQGVTMSEMVAELVDQLRRGELPSLSEANPVRVQQDALRALELLNTETAVVSGTASRLVVQLLAEQVGADRARELHRVAQAKSVAAVQTLVGR